MKRIVYSFFLLLALSAQAQQTPLYLNEDAPVEERVNDLIGRLTIDEEACFCNLMAMVEVRPPRPPV